MAVHLLVVDDEPDLELLIRQKFRKRIRANDWRFSFANDGREALTRIDGDDSIDLVLTDINMPGMDGLTLINHIAERNRTLRTVVVSAYGDLANIRTAMNRGAFDFVTKPIDFEDLERTIEKTWKEVKAFREATAGREHLLALRKELEVARRIQEAVLVNAFPERDDLDVHAAMTPAREVGGDFYDVLELDDTHIGLAVGDVSGKGVSAAMFMAVSRALLQGVALREKDPGTCLTTVNRLLQPQSLPHMFVTLFFGVLDTTTGAFRYANAGHNPPLRLSAGGEVEPLPRTRDLVVAVLASHRYASHDVQLAPGDTLLLYTDGVTEARDPQGEEFGEGRLAEVLRSHPGASAEHLVGHVHDAVDAFAAGTAQVDDLTMLAARYLG